MAFRTHAKDISPLTVHNMFDADFSEQIFHWKMSAEDSRFSDIVQSGIHQRTGGHFQMPLPFKTDVNLPNNKRMALKRLVSLRNKLQKATDYRVVGESGL